MTIFLEFEVFEALATEMVTIILKIFMVIVIAMVMVIVIVTVIVARNGKYAFKNGRDNNSH